MRLDVWPGIRLFVQVCSVLSATGDGRAFAYPVDVKNSDFESTIRKPAVGRGVIYAVGAFGLTFIVLMIVMLAVLGSVVRLG